MYRGLIENMSFVYSFLAKGRGKLDSDQLKAIGHGQQTLLNAAPAVLGREDESTEDKTDLRECQLMMGHIDEMIVFQLGNGEIV